MLASLQRCAMLFLIRQQQRARKNVSIRCSDVVLGSAGGRTWHCAMCRAICWYISTVYVFVVASRPHWKRRELKTSFFFCEWERKTRWIYFWIFRFFFHVFLLYFLSCVSLFCFHFFHQLFPLSYIKFITNWISYWTFHFLPTTSFTFSFGYMEKYFLSEFSFCWGDESFFLLSFNFRTN